jgi:muramoyltetrapeptide carboxypeptidase LdcA involved in peptidoglycan recycling
MIKPPALHPGDKVATVSLSWGGPGAVPHRYAAGKKQLQDEFGMVVVEMPHTMSDPDWLQCNPRARADDLMAAFSDPSIHAIFSTIGGDDSIRLLPYLDLEVIRSNPKVFMGYSDTAITLMAGYKAGLVTFYGPSIMSGFGESGGLFPYMVESVKKSLFSIDPIGEVAPNNAGWTVEILPWEDPANQAKRRRLTPSTGWHYLQGQGVHTGHLIGGCIEVLDWLRGTQIWPSPDDWQDAILFLETSEDAPSPDLVLYYMRTYAAMGILKRLAGVLFARPGGQVPPGKFEEYDRVLLQVITEEEGLTGLPLVTGMDFGHTDPMFVLPYGVQARIDCDHQRFEILESAVVERD